MTTYFSQPGIINAIDPLVSVGGTPMGLVAGSAGAATNNTAVLRGLVALAQGIVSGACPTNPSFGTTILIPGHGIPVGVPGYSGDLGSTYFFEKPNPDGPGITSVIPVSCNWPIRFLGTGSTVLSLREDASGLGFSDFFSVVTGGDNIGGMTFEDLYFTYPNITGKLLTAAIHAPAGGAENVRVIRCAFVDCPNGIIIEDGLQSSIMQCTFQYLNNVGTSITLGNNIPGAGGGAAKQVYIAGNLFLADDDNAQKGSTGIQIYGAEHIKVSDNRIDSYLNGIRITPGPGHNAVRCTFSDVAIFCGTSEKNMGAIGQAVTIQPVSDEDDPSVAQVSFTSCSFEMGETATPTTGGAGVLVDASNGTVDNVRFVSCYSTRWPGPGLSVIGVATNIEINGGFFGGNQYAPVPSSQSYGIYVNEAEGVKIVGAGCVGGYDWVTVSDTVPTDVQDVGIFIDSLASGVLISGCEATGNLKAGIRVQGGATDVNIVGCDLKGNLTAPLGPGSAVVIDGTTAAVNDVSIRDCDVGYPSGWTEAVSILGSTTQTTLQITNCSGYNDQAPLLTTTLPASATLFYGYQHNYYGPVTFFLGASSDVTHVKIHGNDTGVKTGMFLLQPGVSGEIDLGALPTPTFAMIGQ